MWTFFIALAALIGGYLIYSRVSEKVFAIDDRKTPAIDHPDGVDIQPLPKWKAFLIELLNTSTRLVCLLLTRVERMAFGTDLNVDLLLRGSGRKCVATVAGDRRLIIIRMDPFSHFFLTSFMLSFCGVCNSIHLISTAIVV